MAVVTPIPPSDAAEVEALLRRHTLRGRTLDFFRRKPLGTNGLEAASPRLASILVVAEMAVRRSPSHPANWP